MASKLQKILSVAAITIETLLVLAFLFIELIFLAVNFRGSLAVNIGVIAGIAGLLYFGLKKLSGV